MTRTEIGEFGVGDFIIYHGYVGVWTPIYIYLHDWGMGTEDLVVSQNEADSDMTTDQFMFPCGLALNSA